jgi:hypothetical protein
MRLISLLFVVLPSAVVAQDAAQGRALYETHCGGCHYERVHERLRSDVRDLSDLRDMVARWAPQTKRTYTLDELEDIVQYLNESHYRFGLPPRKAHGDSLTRIKSPARRPVSLEAIEKGDRYEPDTCSNRSLSSRSEQPRFWRGRSSPREHG